MLLCKAAIAGIAPFRRILSREAGCCPFFIPTGEIMLNDRFERI
jgi:hypothetical protein